MPIRHKATKRRGGTVSVTRTTRKLTLADHSAVTLEPNAADKKRRGK